MKEYIKQKNLEKKEWLIYNQIPIHIINPFPKHLNIQEIIDILEKKIPSHLFLQSNIEGIYIGSYKELISRNIQAMYMDSIIYLSNHNDNVKTSTHQIAKDIVHELTHALVSEISSFDIFDEDFEREFLSKRNKLASLLEMEDINTKSYDFQNLEYDEDFDLFLFKKIGYELLSVLTIGLFDSPYSATSINEYLANGFEDYFFGNISYLQKISPKLYSKIDSIINYLEGEY